MQHPHQPLPPRDYAVGPAIDWARVRVAESDPPPPPAAAPEAPAGCKWLGYSRTVWLNVAAAVLVFLEANTELMQPLLPVNFYAALAVVLPVANIVLRTLTAQAVRLSPAAVTAANPHHPE